VIVIERPGTGLSDSHRYTSVSKWVADMATVADALDAEKLGVVGISGGGPYALACAALRPMADRVAAVGVLDGTLLKTLPRHLRQARLSEPELKGHFANLSRSPVARNARRSIAACTEDSDPTIRTLPFARVTAV
jgi:pimeloyl-ACP methyl ester carboxylesterase